MSTEAPTLEERYSAAVFSSNLKSEPGHRGAVDLLVAAGWSDALGSSLLRLRTEYDQVAQEARRINSQTDALLVMGRLKSLTSTRVQLVRFGMDAARRWRVELEPQVVAILVGQCLSAWLERNCHKCNGTGRIGGYDGKAANICRRCGGSGRAHETVGREGAERNYSVKLLSLMDAGTSEAQTRMRHVLR